MAEPTATVASMSQGLADLKQSWKRIAAETAPGVPELAGVIDQSMGQLGPQGASEDSLSQLAQSLAARVQGAGFSREAQTMFRRMGRAMYELLLLVGTEEELRSMGGSVPAESVAAPSAWPEPPQSGPAAASGPVPATSAPLPPEALTRTPEVVLAAPPPPAASAPAPAPREPTQTAEAPEEGSVWGFDPSSRNEQPTLPPSPAVEVGPAPGPAEAPVPDSIPELEPEPAVEEEEGSADLPSQAVGWAVRLSPKAAEARRLRLERRQQEIGPLLEDILRQAQQQQEQARSKASGRRAAELAESSPPVADPQEALGLIESSLLACRYPETTALLLGYLQMNPGEVGAALACKVGEAVMSSGDEELTVLCLTAAIMADPPCQRACWGLASIALDKRDPNLAPRWLELIARLLRVDGSDHDAVVVYRQLLLLTPRRSDIREILRTASLTGALPD